MSEEQKPKDGPQPPVKESLSLEILTQQRDEAVKQLNRKLDEVEQLKGIVNYISGLIGKYELPSKQEKLPDEKK